MVCIAVAMEGGVVMRKEELFRLLIAIAFAVTLFIILLWRSPSQMKPLKIDFWDFLSSIGISLTLIIMALIVSIVFTFTSLLKTFLKKRKLLKPLLWLSQLLRFLFYFLSAIPILFAGDLISTLSTSHFNTSMTYNPDLSVFSPNNLRILIIAAFIFGIGDGFLAEVIRHSQDEIEYVLRQNYVRMTKALGRAFWQAAKNDLIIHTTRVFSSRFVVLISGTVVIELMFRIPGIGFWVLRAADASNFYVLSGILSLTVFIVCILNFIHRIIATRLDPRL